MRKHSVRGIFSAGLRLKCPSCGEGDLFTGMFKMCSECSCCHFKFEREMGYFVGAMYINYGATIIMAFAGFFALEYLTPIAYYLNVILWIVFCVPFPIFFFRYSRSLWLSFDYIVNPAEAPAPRPEGVSSAHQHTPSQSQKRSNREG